MTSEGIGLTAADGKDGQRALGARPTVKVALPNEFKRAPVNHSAWGAMAAYASASNASSEGESAAGASGVVVAIGDAEKPHASIRRFNENP